MKKLILLLALIYSLPSFSQVTSCMTANAFCTETNYLFENETGTSAPNGPDYGCLGSTPSPIWYHMRISSSGALQMNLSQTTGPNNTGSTIDIDFAMWGPYSSLAAGCAAVMSGAAPIQCSYSSSSVETVAIGMDGGTGSGFSNPPVAVTGEYYIVLLTNFSDVAGYISFNQTGGTGQADCSIVDPCVISNFTATVGACNTATNTYSVTGSISYSNPPTTGQLIVRGCDGVNTVVASAPFTGTNASYTIPNLPAGSGACTVETYFTAGSCSQLLTYTAPTCPVSCAITEISTNTSACLPGNVFNVTGSLTFSNPPTQVS